MITSVEFKSSVAFNLSGRLKVVLAFITIKYQSKDTGKMDLPAEAKSNIAGYRAFPFATLRVANMFGVPPFGFITPFAPLIPQRPPLAVAPTSANAFHYISLCKLSIASSSSFIVFEWSFFLLLDFPVTKNSTDVFKASAIVTACSAFGSLSLLIHDCNVL